MSFNIALSGLAAAQKDIDTTANNIANVNTTGFKESRAEFADVYAASVFSSNKTKVGDGVTTSKIAQQFSQGSLKFTNNSLDLAITGDGFFAMAPELGSRDYSYTRAGAFKLDKNNFISDNDGGYLQGFPVDPSSGLTTSVSLSTTSPIQIPTTAGAPRPTSNVFVSMNVDSRNAPPTIAFDPTDTASYNSSTSTTIYDSLGEPHILTMYFRRADPVIDNDWEVYAVLDDNNVVPPSPAGGPLTPNTAIGPIVMDFDATGNPVPPLTASLPNLVLPAADLNNPANGYLTNGAQFATNITVQFRDSSGTKYPTQFASKFEVGTLSQDGTTVGRLTSVDIDAAGRVMAAYSNGDQTYLAQIAMVKFANPQGLSQAGNTAWRESLLSGEALAGEANSGTFGSINASALEASNVNLTNELVDLIAAQRNFQANSRALEVNSTLQNTVLQIR